MMSWPGELLREVRTRKSWNGVLPTAESRAKKKLSSGMHSWPNAAGAMRPAPIWPRPRSERVGKIAMISKPGWICTTPKKEERQDDFPVRPLSQWPDIDKSSKNFRLEFLEGLEPASSGKLRDCRCVRPNRWLPGLVRARDS